MSRELENLAKDLRKFLASADEEDFILKAAPKPKRAAFVSVKTAKAEVAAASKPASTKTKNAPLTKEQELADLAEKICNCKNCPLGLTRIKAVPGEGNINARIMFIGEGPGYDEDRQGRPFVGRAGQLLDKIIAAMGFKREEVFIANMVKCHPMIDPTNPDKHGNDRPPQMDEIARCRKFVEKQIVLVNPDYVVALGGVAAKSLINEHSPLSALRGKLFDLKLDYYTPEKNIKILATYHPAALLRNPGWKKDAWQNLKVLLADMGAKFPSAKPAKED